MLAYGTQGAIEAFGWQVHGHGAHAHGDAVVLLQIQRVSAAVATALPELSCMNSRCQGPNCLLKGLPVVTTKLTGSTQLACAWL